MVGCVCTEFNRKAQHHGEHGTHHEEHGTRPLQRAFGINIFETKRITAILPFPITRLGNGAPRLGAEPPSGKGQVHLGSRIKRLQNLVPMLRDLQLLIVVVFVVAAAFLLLLLWSRSGERLSS